MEKLVSAGLVIYFETPKQREYLLLHYPHGHWDFVKGKIDQGEGTIEAALRELKEETGLTAQPVMGFEDSFSYTFTLPDGSPAEKKVHFFIGKTNTKEVTLSDEHVGYQWLNYQNARDSLTFDNAKDLLKKAHHFLNTVKPEQKK